MKYQTADALGLTFEQVRRLFPGISFPESGDINTPEVRSYTPTPTPQYNPDTHAVREAAPVGGVQQWEIYPLPAEEVAANQAAAIQAAREQAKAQRQAAREQAKAQRQAAVDAIKVTTQAGNTFDGDETSQTRMTRAVLAMQATGAPSVTWVLADNTVIQATVPELTEALALAGAEQARLWVIE